MKYLFIQKEVNCRKWSIWQQSSNVAFVNSPQALGPDDCAQCIQTTFVMCRARVSIRLHLQSLLDNVNRNENAATSCLCNHSTTQVRYCRILMTNWYWSLQEIFAAFISHQINDNSWDTTHKDCANALIETSNSLILKSLHCNFNYAFITWSIKCCCRLSVNI